MRPRTFLLLILVLLAVIAAVVLIFLVRTGGGPLADFLPGGDDQPIEEPVEVAAEEPSLPTPTPTPQIKFVPVVVARADLPVGERIRRDLIQVEQRPETNVAVLAGVTFSDPELVVGQIVKTRVTRGQEVLRPMLALNPSDLASLGSDLSLYVDQGKVAVAFPIDRFSGASYAMRPGDLVDAFMSLALVELDEEFQTKRPNIWRRVFEPDLLAGRQFLFEPTSEGRLELIAPVNSVAVIGPTIDKEQIPRKVSQLTLQQMEVLWIGSWRDPRQGLRQEFDADVAKAQPTPVPSEDGQPAPPPRPTRERPEVTPDVAILSMSAQDALVMKWALETGIDVDLGLRSQGDTSVFVTTSVSLPQVVEQGVLAVPEPNTFGLEPRVDEVSPPSLPNNPP
jgi:Flp pilus assembly protein CpaB